MKLLTKTMAIEIIGLLTVLFSVNSAFINPYVAAAITSILTLAVYNLWTDETGGKPVINITSVLTFMAAAAGYFLDHPKVEVIDGVQKISYVIPVGLLVSIKGSFIAIVRFIEANFSRKPAPQVDEIGGI